MNLIDQVDAIDREFNDREYRISPEVAAAQLAHYDDVMRKAAAAFDAGATAVQFAGVGFMEEWTLFGARGRRRGIHPNARRRPKRARR